MIPRRARALVPYAAAFVASGVLGAAAITDVLEKVGRPAVPLDDVFIHFQYARRIAEGAPFRYTGDAVSTGMTSLVWPALLAPFWKAGVRGLSLVWVAWAFGTVAHAAVAIEAALLARRLTDGTGALLAGALCLAFGPFAWFAWSGMETMLLAWVVVAGARRAASVLDAGREGRAERSPPAPGGRGASPPLSSKPFVQLAALGFVAPLVRPEGAIVSAFAALAIGLRARGRRRLLAAAPVLGCLALPALYLALTGEPTGATARVKWLVYSPYHDARRLLWQVGQHVELLFFDVLDGGEWTWIFVPKGLVLLVFFGAASLVLVFRRAPWTAALTLVAFAAIVFTCSYQTFLWNRLRYAWPFVPAGLVMCVCFFHELGAALGRAHRALATVTPALGAALATRFATQLPAAISDLSQSARAVDGQQVALGEWVKAELPASALVGVNDTGAIAYFGERRTFDVVGLTTEGEGAAWLAGAGSRFERYERLPRAELPTHFLVYPEWFGCEVVLGEELARRTVVDHAILGGDTMVAYAADYGLLGSGAEPVEVRADEVLADEVDVADLVSEAEHGFALGDAWDAENVVVSRDVTEGPEMADGARRARAVDTFFLSARGAERGARLVMRLGADAKVAVRVLVDGAEAGVIELPESPWIEREIALPPPLSARARVDVIALDASGAPVPQRSRRGPRFTSMHYWLYVRAPSAGFPGGPGETFHARGGAGDAACRQGPGAGRLSAIY